MLLRFLFFPQSFVTGDSIILGIWCHLAQSLDAQVSSPYPTPEKGNGPSVSFSLWVHSYSQRDATQPKQRLLWLGTKDAFLKKIFIYFLFIYFWLCWVFVAALRLSLVAASRGYSSLRCVGFSLRWLLLLRSMGSRRAGFSSCSTWAQ